MSFDLPNHRRTKYDRPGTDDQKAVDKKSVERSELDVETETREEA